MNKVFFKVRFNSTEVGFENFLPSTNSLPANPCANDFVKGTYLRIFGKSLNIWILLLFRVISKASGPLDNGIFAIRNVNLLQSKKKIILKKSAQEIEQN